MADTAQGSFHAFRKVVRPDMLINPFVCRLNRELQRFGEALEAGERPKRRRVGTTGVESN